MRCKRATSDLCRTGAPVLAPAAVCHTSVPAGCGGLRDERQDARRLHDTSRLDEITAAAERLRQLPNLKPRIRSRADGLLADLSLDRSEAMSWAAAPSDAAKVDASPLGFWLGVIGAGAMAVAVSSLEVFRWRHGPQQASARRRVRVIPGACGFKAVRSAPLLEPRRPCFWPPGSRGAAEVVGIDICPFWGRRFGAIRSK